MENLVNRTSFDKIYRNKKVLVTGHTGFKGSWLSLWLKMLGAEIIGYSIDPPSIPSFFEIIGLEEELIHIYGDVRNFEYLQQIFHKNKPDIVFHLAAQPLVRVSYNEPRQTYETNVMGTVNVLEAARHTESVRAIINITSDKCYENREWVWGYRENDPMGGDDPYSSSKGCAELVATAYLRSFFSPETYGKRHHIALASARAGNVIGGGDWGTDRLVPDCIRSLTQDEPIIIRYPKATRPWQHVLEPLSGYLLLGARLWEQGARFSGSWNFGPTDDEEWSVEDVVKESIRLWGNGRYNVQSQGILHEASQLRLDCSKARIELGWNSKYSVRQTLGKTISWYKEFCNGSDRKELKAFTERQIGEYVRR